MAILYYDVNITEPEGYDELKAPILDYVAYDNTEKELHISVSCRGDHDYGLESKTLSGRMKELEVAIETYDGKTIHEYEMMTKKDYSLILESKPYELGIYTADTPELNFSKGINPDIEIHFGDGEKEWKQSAIDVICYAD